MYALSSMVMNAISLFFSKDSKDQANDIAYSIGLYIDYVYVLN